MPSFHWTPLSPSRLHRLGLGAVYGMTDTGRVRQANEDNFLIDEQLGLVMVADGMGGHQAGAIASTEALQAVRRHLAAAPPVADDDITIPAALAALLSSNAAGSAVTAQDIPTLIGIFNAVEFANRRLYAQNAANGHADGDGMGTTLTGFRQCRPGGPLLVFHVGDSRLYRYRGGQLEQLTRDQSLYQHMLDSGMVDNLPARNMLLQAVGPAETILPAIQAEQTQSGDVYLLCSDGLHGKLPLMEITRILAATTVNNIDCSCEELITLANRYDGKDNVTAVLALCE